MAIGDVYAARVIVATADQIGVNVHHYLVTNEVGLGATPSLMALSFDTEYSAPYKALLHASAEYRGVGVKRVRPLPPGSEGISTINAGSGLVLNDIMAKQVSGLITWRTAFGGRSFRGRTYVPFPGEADNAAGGLPGFNYITGLGALATVITGSRVIGDIDNSTTLQHVIYSRLLDSANFVTTFIARTSWATQRRRGDFGAINTPPF